MEQGGGGEGGGGGGGGEELMELDGGGEGTAAVAAGDELLELGGRGEGTAATAAGEDLMDLGGGGEGGAAAAAGEELMELGGRGEGAAAAAAGEELMELGGRGEGAAAAAAGEELMELGGRGEGTAAAAAGEELMELGVRGEGTAAAAAGEQLMELGGDRGEGAAAAAAGLELLELGGGGEGTAAAAAGEELLEVGGGGEGTAAAAAGEELMELGGGGEGTAAAAAGKELMELGGRGEGSADAGGGEDRLSALPDDVLVQILNKLGTRAAAQTRVLSRQWRRIWRLLPDLFFYEPPEPHQLRDVLDDHDVLLRNLLVWLMTEGATPESVAVWLPAAARRVSGCMYLKVWPTVEDAAEDYDSEEEHEEAAWFELPCFEKATKILIDLNFQGLTMPVTGVFARLTELFLSRVRFHGPGELGDAVSSPGCPRLQKLNVQDARGLQDLAIHSESILWMKLRNLRALSRLTVVAPALKELTVAYCFGKSLPVASVSAPLLSSLEWVDVYHPSSVHFDKMAHLQCLAVQGYRVYGQNFMRNESCLSLLGRFEVMETLSLKLVYRENIENYDYLMEGMAVLPNITFLCLMVNANGHAFGASAFHVLRLCTGIRRLKLGLAYAVSEAEAVCSSNCKCLELVEWETEELLLNHLEEVEIWEWRGTEHEVAFVKRLFDWGTKLKEMKVNFKCFSTSEVKAKELYQTFQSFSRPGVCVKFFRNALLYAPED